MPLVCIKGGRALTGSDARAASSDDLNEPFVVMTVPEESFAFALVAAATLRVVDASAACSFPTSLLGADVLFIL